MREVPAPDAAHLPHPPRRSVLAGAVLLFAAVIAGCSGDEPTAASTTPSTAPVTNAPVTTAPPTTSTSTSTSTTTAPPPPTSVNAAWCGPAADVRDASDRFEETITDPDEVRTVVTELALAVEAAAEVAPDELADEVATTEEILVELDRALAATDYDLLTADLSVFAERADELEAANEVIRAYNTEFCGFDPDRDATDDDDDDVDAGDGDDGDDGVDFDFGAGSFRDQFIGQLVDNGFTLPEAACLFGEIDFTDPDTYTGDDAVTALFVACDIDVDRIDELAVLEGGA